MKEIRKKVFVGMSGGVDSAVAAALLKQEGYEVTGVFIRVWEPAEGEAGYRCTWRADRRDAMRVAATLGLALITLDLRKEYKREVVDYMLSEYATGRTPNPDVMCNKYIKFGAFYDWARAHGADYVATGHYCQIKDGQLLVSKDGNKDQTYFLWTLNKDHLAHSLFPIGGYKKLLVRKMAERFKLPVAEKKDSQGICFVGKLDLKEFLKGHIASRPGKVLNEKGEVIGHHDGAIFYTIGERHGFIIDQKATNSKPLYVASKNIKNNTLTVSARKINQTNKDEKITLRDINWINDSVKKGVDYCGRVRYRQPLLPCTITSLAKNQAKIKFSPNPGFVAPGQSLVLYDRTGKVCLGGGVIS